MGSPASRPSPRDSGWTAVSVLRVIRRAAAAEGQPLSHARFQAWARKNQVPVPSILTIIDRHGSWSQACADAGLRTNKQRFHDVSPSTKVSKTTCRNAVRAFIDLCAAEGLKPSAHRYKTMSAAKGWPSFGTLRYQLQMPWADILATRGGGTERRSSRGASSQIA